MSVAPERRIWSWVMTKIAAGAWLRRSAVLDTEVTWTFANSSRDNPARASSGGFWISAAPTGRDDVNRKASHGAARLAAPRGVPACFILDGDKPLFYRARNPA